MEATGGLETAVGCALQTEGFEAVINPRQASDFTRTMRYLAKTDPIDDRVLSQISHFKEPAKRLSSIKGVDTMTAAGRTYLSSVF